jgi:hypothetical protein
MIQGMCEYYSPTIGININAGKNVEKCITLAFSFSLYGLKNLFLGEILHSLI